MAAIRKFFEKKKMDFKFKKAGDGHRLTDAPSSSASSRVLATQPAASARAGPSSESSAAAAAALNRVEKKKAEMPTQVGTGSSAIKAQVKREMENDRKMAERARKEAEMYGSPKESYIKTTKIQNVTGVFYRCPMIGSKVLSKDEMNAYIEEFLYSQLGSEPQLTSSLMIHTLNKDKDKVADCITILEKYLDNIMAHPGEEKYCKIRLGNKAFQEKVSPINGAIEFLQAAGFEHKQLPYQPTPDAEPQIVDHLVFDPGLSEDLDRLQALKDCLKSAEPIKPELDPDIRVYHPSAHAEHISVPDCFYSMTVDEIKREQQRRQEACERLGMLRTKEMRERERAKELRQYRFALIRVRLPDNLLLQATFRASAPLSNLRDLVRECLREDIAMLPFVLSSQTGNRFMDSDEKSSLAELGLAPAAVVNLSWDTSLIADINQSNTSHKISSPFLSAEWMANISSL